MAGERTMMKVYFDADGSLTVEGENATEWLALRTWADNWTALKVPLWVRTMDHDTGDTQLKPPPLRPSLRQLFKDRPDNYDAAGHAAAYPGF
jgi:hypothetical protein